MNRKSSQSRKWQELFALLKLSEPEQQAAQAYLAGEAGEEALAKISFLDLSAVPEALPKKRFYDLIQKKNRIGLQDVKADMGRLFELLFARGKSTCYAMVPPEIFRILKPTEWWDAPRMTAVHAAQVGLEDFLHSHRLLSVLEIAGEKPEILRQALDLEVNAAPNGKFILLALYFAEKYPKSIAFAPTAEDLPLFLQYEEMAVTFFGDLYFGRTDAAFLEELSGELAAGGTPECFAEFTGTNAQVSREKLRLTAGLSYWNYTCSETLKNIVRLCFLAGMPETLDALCAVSRGTKVDICTKGGRYDEEFGLNSEEYLRWAVEGSHRNIMRKQLAENTECYVRVMEWMPTDYANKMFLLMKEEKPERYEEILAQQKKNGNNAEKEKLIDVVVHQDANLNAVKQWLRGEITLAEFCEHFDRSLAGAYGGTYEWELITEYCENYKDEELFRRCEVYMLLNGRGAFFGRQVKHQGRWATDRLEIERVKKVFADFEAEGLGLDLQLPFVGLVSEQLYNKEEQEKFFCCVKEYLGEHLKEQREETLKCLAGADSFARCVGLQVLAQDAARNKKEILKYVQDGAKTVKQQLFEILCEQREWETDVKGLLASRKAAERELGIQVLLHWQEAGADYQECFMQALTKEKNAKVRALLEGALGIKKDEEEAEKTGVVSREDLVRSLHKGGKKRVLAWAYETPFSAVHVVDAVRLTGDGNGAGKENAQQEKDGNGTRKNEALSARDGNGIRNNEALSAEDGNVAGKGRVLQNSNADSTGKNAAMQKKSAERLVADEEYLQAILLCYACADSYGVSKDAAFLAEGLDAGELAVYANELFDKWMSAGAEAKKRWVLYAAAIHGGSAIIEKLHRQIKEWPGQARGAIACEAVKALSLNPLPQALLIVDGIARKFKFKQVRSAAGAALEFAAAQLGITREELADRIVPDFGFDEKVERVFDYGERRFLVTLTTALEVEVFEAVETAAADGAPRVAAMDEKMIKGGRTQKSVSIDTGSKKALTDSDDCGKNIGTGESGAEENEIARGSHTQNGVIDATKNPQYNITRGKKLKTLPAPGKKDDAAKAAAAYEEFKQMKKQIKATVNSQKQRLEMALSTAREWSLDAWRQLFVKNLVMHQFAIGLVWGIYEDGKLVQSFRYMEDGSFNTEDGEEFEFPGGENAKLSAVEKSLAGILNGEDVKLLANETSVADIKIGLVHPVELSEKSRAAWKEQLSDYEIVPPFEQLDRAVYVMTKEEADSQELTRFEDETVNDLALGSRLLALGWYRGPVQDAGCFDLYYREDNEIGLGVELHFSGSFVGGENEDVTIYGVRFYKAGTVARDRYGYDEADKEKAYFLRDVPARYFSEVVWQLVKAVG